MAVMFMLKRINKKSNFRKFLFIVSPLRVHLSIAYAKIFYINGNGTCVTSSDVSVVTDRARSVALVVELKP